MTRPVLVGLLSGALVVSLAGAAVQSADEVVEKHLAAIGGRSALAKLTTRRATGTVTITTPGGDVTGPIEISAKAPNKARAHMRLDLTPLGLPETMMLEQKFDGTDGWMLNSVQGDTQITGNQLDNMRNNAFPSPLMAYKTGGATLELLPRETLDGRELVVLRMTPKAGSAVTMLFDASTYLLARSRLTVVTAELGPLDQTVELSDYRDVGGIKLPFQVVNSTPVQTVKMKFEKIEHNVPVDDAVFVVKLLPQP